VTLELDMILVVPMVGAFVLDFTDTLIVTTFIDWVH
jgi:Na+/glutamate symporter